MDYSQHLVIRQILWLLKCFENKDTMPPLTFGVWVFFYTSCYRGKYDNQGLSRKGPDYSILHLQQHDYLNLKFIEKRHLQMDQQIHLMKY